MSNLYNEMLEFAKQNIAPYTKEIDDESKFPVDSFKAIKDKKLTGLLVPKEFGGMGLGFYEHTQTILAFANYCATTALCYMMHNVATNCLATHGSDELKKEILPKIANGEVMLALAYSESGTGTHFYIPEIKVTKDGQTLFMNGRKSFVTSAEYADYYLIDANSFDNTGLDNWIVSKELAGVSFEHSSWNGLGMKGNASCPMILNNVKIDEKYRIGTSGTGLDQIMNTVGPFFIIGLAAVYSGVALNACNTIVEYSMNRKYSDESALCNIPTVQNHLADIYTKSTSAKFFTLSAAKSVVEADPAALANVIAARLNASKITVDVCTKAMKIGGGTAYAKRLTIERLLRDSLAAQVMAPSTDVLTTWLGKALTNQEII
ncbi:acyl-CoA/acyl-ACP dehydrogenase [Arcobacter lanthieri]|uniref:acyl-CoA dehydrogenase family protein n=1 Tax=Aliarcobacter lanthieri TaxID=1355374 RepID=UPI0019239E07|nr:acyl-CoA dehydrogenase family protein [Aliarcobacter lanthieri]MBL3519962.1 acyl-CoA/acyl-ACP dehydrogenase [Aliarcobacter lanthieri]